MVRYNANFLLGCYGWRPSEMPRTDTHTTRFWLWFLKVPMIIVVGIAAFAARKDFNSITKHPQLLQSPPYDPHVEIAQLLAYVGLISLFPWLFISSGITFFAQGGWFAVMAFIDLGLAIVIAIGLQLEAGYLPSTTGGCAPQKIESWQVPEGTKSFFTLAMELNHHKNASQACNTLVKDWQLAVAAIFFQLVIAYVGLFSDIRERSIMHPCRPLYVVLMLFIMPIVIIHDHLVPRIRFYYHASTKLTRRFRGLEPLSLPQKVTYTPLTYEYAISNPKLQEILTIEHILAELVSNLHYEDVINLSLTSRSIRDAVFPGRDLHYRIPKLRAWACEKSSKTKCPYCNKEVCQSCTTHRLLPGLPGHRHVYYCKPYCRPCYYKNFSRHPRLTYKKPCQCHALDRALEPQSLCKTCGTKDQEQLQGPRFLRYRAQARDVAFGREKAEIGLCVGVTTQDRGVKYGPEHERYGKTQCGKCEKELKPGIRYWVCGKCGGECTDDIHPAFVGKLRERDVESGGLYEVKTGAGMWVRGVLKRWFAGSGKAG